MKVRNGFVSNSSSSSFIITNTTNEHKTIKDFVLENTHLFYDFCDRYDEKEDEYFSLGKMIDDAEFNYDIKFEPKESKSCVFGDEDGTTLGRVFDYILRDGGKSKSFEWRFDQFYR